MNNNKIVLGMSGGIDSSISLTLLKKQGFDPVGVSLQYCVFSKNTKCNKQNIKTAEKVCKKYGVEHHYLEVSDKFQKIVVDKFINDFKKGLTPNPCIVCNRFLKFKTLFEFADNNNIEYVATGHYAKIKKTRGEYYLQKAVDKSKDQTYYLCLLKKEWVKRIKFPLGGYKKDKVFEIAKEENLDFLTKKEQSQDLCFISDKNVNHFLRSKLGENHGKIIDSEGNKIGEHPGLHFYTIGQRKGIGLSGGPWYVVKKDFENNLLVVANKENEKKYYKKEIVLKDFNLFKDLKNSLPVKAKVRYQQPEKKAVLNKIGDNQLKIIFDRPQRAVTPGQWAVFYQNNICLGGGKISF